MSDTATTPRLITVRTRSSGAAVAGAASETSGTFTANSLSSQSYSRVAAMKNTKRQRMTSTIGVMLITGISSTGMRLASIRMVLLGGDRVEWACGEREGRGVVRAPWECTGDWRQIKVH